MVGSIFLLQVAEPLSCHLHEVCQTTFYLLYLVLQAGNEVISLVLVELQDACHLDFHESENIVLRHLTDEHRIERSQSLVDVFASSIHRLGILEFLCLVDALLDEDFLQRSKVQLFQQFPSTDFELELNQTLRVIH